MKSKDCTLSIFRSFIGLALAIFLLFCCGAVIYAGVSEISADQLYLWRLEFMPGVKAMLRPELRERTTFIYLTLLSPMICWTAICIGNIFSNPTRRTEANRALIIGTFALNICVLTAVALCLYRPQDHPQFMYMLFDPVWDRPFLLLGALALSLTVIYGLFKLDLNEWFGKYLLLLLPVIPVAQVCCCRIYTLNLISSEVTAHPNIIAYALSQAATGNADYHQYGFYHRILAPVFNIFSPNMLGISVVMGGLFVVGCLAVYAAVFKCVKNKALVLAFALIFFLTTGMWLFFDPARFSSIDPYFAYYPVRFIFPALSVWSYSCWIFLRKKYMPPLCGILAGAGAWWNIDSGIVVIGAFLAVMLMELVFSKTRRTGLMPLALFCIGALATFSALLTIFSVQQKTAISPVESLKYIKIFSSSGFMMLPLPKPPAAWCVFIAIYLLGLLTGLHLFISGKSNILAKMSIFLSVLGTGLFTYYQGRSHIWSLPAVIWPALILMFIYTDRIIRLVKTGLINKAFMMLALPAVFATACATITIVVYSPMVAAGIERTWRGVVFPDESNPLEQDIRFILTNAGNNKTVNIVSDMQGVYYAETGLRAGIDNFGMAELFFIKDWARIGNELKKAEFPLFISKPYAGNWLYKYYRLQAINQNGTLLYLTPRAAPPGETLK